MKKGGDQGVMGVVNGVCEQDEMFRGLGFEM